MAAPDYSLPASVASTPPEGFHYETKYIVLTYLGMVPAHQSRPLTTTQEDGQSERERTGRLKGQIEEELRKLEDEMAASTVFDRRSSQVLTPANPETFTEECLAVMGERVAGELDASLAAAARALLAGPLDYERFRDTALALSTHTQGGWSRVLVPLLLLQALQCEGQSLATLLHLGMRLLEEEEADFVIQQGGWGEIFRLGAEEEQGVTIAEDGNDIYILSGEQHPDRPSLPSSLLCTGDGSWQTESLPVSLAGHESWAQVDAMERDDAKSLDSNEGAALAEERSENNSSNSDIVHVEREEAELLDEGGAAIDESMMSVLGTESDLAALREEFRDHTPPVLVSAEAAAPASLISLEEPVVLEMPACVSAEPSLVFSEPELLPSLDPEPVAAPPAEAEPAEALPVPAAEPEPGQEQADAPEQLPAETPTAPAETEVTPEPALEPEQGPESVAVPPQPEPETVEESVLAPVAAPLGPEAAEAPVEAPAEEPPVKPEPESDLPALFYGSAALVVLVAVIAYTVLSYRRL